MKPTPTRRTLNTTFTLEMFCALIVLGRIWGLTQKNVIIERAVREAAKRERGVA